MIDELKLAVRRLLKNRGATLAAIFALSLAMGAATATWSLLSAVLLRPLRLHEPDRLFVVESRITQGSRAGGSRPASPICLCPTFARAASSNVSPRSGCRIT